MRGSIKKLLALAGIGFTLKKVIDIAGEIDVKDKIAFITGGSRGLGLLLTRQLIQEGAKVAVCARDVDELARAASEFNSDHFLTIQCDIQKKAEVKSAVDKVVERWGNIDILINNAGIIQTGPYDSMTEEDFIQAMRTHFWGPYHFINEVIPYMEDKGGNIVNISSIGGKISFPHLIPYNASKFALAGFSEGITAELSRKKITVTTVYPGLMRTGSPGNIQVKGQHEKEYAWFKITDSIPGLSMHAEKAARSILKAMKRGRKTLVLSFPAKLAIAMHGISPGLNITFFDLINRLLPENGPDGRQIKKGYESESRLSSNILTRTTEKAAKKNNEI